MPAAQIVGLVLVRNEDIHVGRAVANITAFCDRILLADHCSEDRTPAILADLAARYPHVELHPVAHPRESHALVSGYAGSDTWVFAVDGDEIYDPAGLAELRTRILAGVYDRWWMIFGNVLNCDWVDAAGGGAAGYLAPPCRSITKLYNFSLIHAWDGDTPERLHGGRITFKEGFDASLRLNLHEQTSWEESVFRCLHTCFVRRSSAEPTVENAGADGALPARENIMDLHKYSLTAWIRRIYARLAGRAAVSVWKLERYRRGPRVRVDAASFFR